LFQGNDGGGHLHNIVGGLGMASLYFLYITILPDDASVTARARIAFASPIGKYFNLIHDSDFDLRGIGAPFLQVCQLTYRVTITHSFYWRNLIFAIFVDSSKGVNEKL